MPVPQMQTYIHELQRFRDDREIPSTFIRRVLENNLVGAVEVASRADLLMLPVLTAWLVGHMPIDAWMCDENVQCHLLEWENDESQTSTMKVWPIAEAVTA